MSLIAIGTLVLLERGGRLELDFGVLTPLVCAALGAVLLATGLSRRE